MKNLLNYQTSEYDCGPVSILNGIRYLFEREEIYPDIVKFIMLYCMDTYNEHGELCKRGTSAAAVHYMSNWLNHFSETRNFPIHCDYIKKEEVPAQRSGTPSKTAVPLSCASAWTAGITCCSPVWTERTVFFFLIHIMKRSMIRSSTTNTKRKRLNFFIICQSAPTARFPSAD